MKIVIISDIHGNLEALNRVLKYIDNMEGEKRIVCLGDIVGYGPNPAECFKIVESLTDKICLGNHEYAIPNEDFDYQMVKSARDAIRWTRGVVGEEIREAISRLPIQIDEITTKSGLPASNVASILMILEVKRLVKQLSGKRFVKA